MLLHILLISLILNAIFIASAEFEVQLTDDISEALSHRNDNTNYTKVGDKLLYFSESKVNWHTALLNCRAVDGYLVSFYTPSIMEPLVNYLPANYASDRSWWSSGSNLQAQNDFQWYGAALPFIPTVISTVQFGSKDENCLALTHQDTEYQLKALNCEIELYYICEAEKSEAIVISML